MRSQLEDTLPRLQRRSGVNAPWRQIDFRHVIESLLGNPRPLLGAQLQNDLLLGESWRQRLAALPPDEAARVMVYFLHVTAKDDDLAGVERYLRRQLLSRDRRLTGRHEHYGLHPPRGQRALPQLDSSECHLSSYNELLGRSSHPPGTESALASLWKQLRLTQYRCQWQAAEQQAQADCWSQANYLYVLTEQEHQQRH
jgi:hypothetical protein